MNSGDTVTYQGYEVALWPLEYVNITAGPWASNHIVEGIANSGCWDNGWYQTQRRPLYAPFSMECIRSYPTGSSNGHGQLWRSLDKVWLPGESQPQYATFMVLHSNTLYYGQGDTISQGTHFFDTGDFGLGSGPHVHFIIMVGYYNQAFPVGTNPTYGNIWYSPNAPANIADYFYLTGTEPFVGSGGAGGLTWKTWEGSPIGPTPGGQLAAAILALFKLRKEKKRVRI